MLKLIVRQANWGIIGSVFAFVVGFFVKTYVIREVGTSEWGKYATAHTFTMFADTILSLGIPLVILKFFPSFMQSNREKAKFLIHKFLKYALIISILFLSIMFFSSSFIDKYIYVNINNFSYLLLIISIHAPISIFMGIITSMYRSVLKIREIIIFGTFVSVPLRAFLTFLVFQFSSDIVYFVFAELLTQFVVIFLLYYNFHRKEMNLLVGNVPKLELGKDVVKYAKNIYLNSIIVFFSGQSLAFVLGIMLPPKMMGVYSIILTITALTLFLNKNLRKIFAPVISKLYSEKNFSELNLLYKKTTFMINLLTIPFSILIIFFTDDILMVFAKDGSLLEYRNYLIVVMIARIISLLAGNTGSFMLMAGLEKQSLYIESVKAILITGLAVYLVEDYGLSAIVSLYIIFMLLSNLSRLFFIQKNININPFSKELFWLIFCSVPLFWASITFSSQINTNMYYYLLAPVLLYLLYFLVFYKNIKTLYKEII